jgi:predicted nucleotidyltransferase
VSTPTSAGRFKYYRMGLEERLIDKLRELLQGVKGVSFAYVYGSFLKRELFRDVDVWIEEGEDPFEYEVVLSSRIEAYLEVPIDIHVLNETPITFRYAVFTEGRLLFSREERTRVEVVDETIRQYADLRMLRSLCEAEK